MNDFDSIIKRMTVTRLEPGDYTGEDGLLYCGKCRTPKQFRMEAPPLEAACSPIPAAVSRRGLTGRQRSRGPAVTVRPWPT